MKLIELLESVSIKPSAKHRGRILFQHDSTGASAELVDQGDVTLVSNVKTPSDSRNRGGATALFGKITRYADENGLKLRLNLLPDEDTDQDRLKSFYEKFGFKSTRGIEMVRMPKADK